MALSLAAFSYDAYTRNCQVHVTYIAAQGGLRMRGEYNTWWWYDESWLFRPTWQCGLQTHWSNIAAATGGLITRVSWAFTVMVKLPYSKATFPIPPATP